MLDKEYQAPLDWIASQAQHMTFLTEAFSKINSGSYHIEGLRAMRAALADNFLWLEGTQEVIPLEPVTQVNEKGETITIPMAEALSIRKRPEAPIQVLLMGHMDTVFGPEHAFQKPRYLSETVLNGPGVADLKGGLVVMLKALEALERSPWKNQLGWQVLLNPDEEIGSLASDPLIKRAAEGKHLGLIYEPCLADGSIVGVRKGSGNFSIVIRGRAAHAGRNPQDGRNAIVAAAELTSELFALNGKREGLTLNPGRVEGGGALNVVPDLAILHFNIRTRAVEDEGWVMEQIERTLQGIRGKDGFSAELYGSFSRTPKPLHPRIQEVIDMVQSCGKDLGITIGVKASGGCCDGNNLWKYGLPNVDTLGVRGEHIHSDKEIVHLDSLVERAQLSALLLMRLASGALSLSNKVG